MARRTLIIGGTRNLGPALVAALQQLGDDITVIHRGVTPAPFTGVTEHHADRGDPAALRQAIGNATHDLVVDTTLYTGAETETVIRLLDGNVGRYVFWSTGQVYLVREGLAPPFTEAMYDGPVMPEPPRERTVDHENWEYGIGKRAAEDALRLAFETRGFPYVSLRMPMINSARDHYRRLDAYVHRILDGGPIVIPDDQDRLRLRHVFGDDVVRATLLAAAWPAGTCLNIAQDETLTLAAMLGLVAHSLGARARTAPVPRAALEARGLLPACSPWSGRWMSVLDNAASRALGMTYANPATYLPPLVERARQSDRASAPGYDRRAEELALVPA